MRGLVGISRSGYWHSNLPKNLSKDVPMSREAFAPSPPTLPIYRLFFCFFDPTKPPNQTNNLPSLSVRHIISIYIYISFLRGDLPSQPMEVVSPTPAKSVLPSRSSHCSRPSSSSWISSPYISNGSIGSSNSRHGGSRLRIISRIADSVPWKNQGGTCSSNRTSSSSSACNGNGNGGFGFVFGERVEEKRRRERAAGVVVCSAGAGGIGREEEAIRIPERAKVVALVSLVMCLCNADRVVMSVAVVPLAAKYGWSSSFLGIVQSSFLWGYLFSSVAGGALADRYGGKRVMAWGVALWSIATFLTPWAADHSTAMLLAVRALFGLAEGVALPSMNTLLSRWFPCHERASAVGLSMAGFHLGNVISFLATPIIMSSIGLAGAFSLFASLGFMWLSLWVNGVTNDPGDSPLISTYELQLIRAGKTDVSSSSGSKFPPLRHLLSKLPTWAIIFANVTNNWGYFVLLSWMPVYFKTVYNVNLKQAAWFSAVPWGMMAISGYIAGAASDSLIASGHPVTRVRKIMQSIGFIGPALALLCLKYAQTPNAAAFLMTVALSFSSFSQAGFLLNMQDIAPRYAGFLHGITNSVGTLAAIISTIGTGYFVQWLGSFQAFLTLTSALYFITTIFWNLFATGEQVFY